MQSDKYQSSEKWAEVIFFIAVLDRHHLFTFTMPRALRVHPKFLAIICKYLVIIGFCLHRSL